MQTAAPQPALKRALGLPLLVFYGLGVTVGAGIFALIGEILGIAGDRAPLAFLVAGATAGATARAYALLSRRYPAAAGAALYAKEGFGATAARIAGVGVALTGIVSSSVITLAFAGYVGTLTGLSGTVLVIAMLAAVAAVASYGIRESVGLASLITVLEVGTLIVIAAVGLPMLADADLLGRFAALPTDRVSLDLTIAAAAVAFFAFIGFEDIVNMAEEARDPERTLGLAIVITLLATTVLYVVIAAVAAAVPGRAALVSSEAPLADLFAGLTGLPAAPIAAIASVAMINGILVQVLMASRLMYGMANQGLLPKWFAVIAPHRRTPIRATVVVTLLIAALALSAPLLGLAQATGYVTLVVFAIVNLSLYRVAGRRDWTGSPHQRWWGVVGAALAIGLLAYEAQRAILGGG